MSATNERDRLLDWAVSTSRIDQGARAAWAALYDRDPVAATRDLGSMAPPRAAAAAAGRRPSRPAVAVAAASDTNVLPGDVFPRVPQGRDQITLSARDYELMRVAAEARIHDVGRQVREEKLAGAQSAGRIAASAVPEWRAKYNADPVGAVRELEALPAGAHAVSTAKSAASSSAATASAVERWKAGDVSFVKPGPGSLLGGGG